MTKNTKILLGVVGAYLLYQWYKKSTAETSSFVVTATVPGQAPSTTTFTN